MYNKNVTDNADERKITMAINLNKDHYRGKKNSAVYPNAYIDSDGEIYPNGKPAESTSQEIYPQKKSAEAVHEAYPNIQTVGNDVPAQPQNNEVRTLPPQSGVPAVRKRKGFSKGAAAFLVVLSVIAMFALPVMMIAGDSDYDTSSSYDWEEYNGNGTEYYDFASSGTKLITVSADSSEVYVSASGTDMIGVSCSGDEQVVLEDGVLTIEQGDSSGSDISIYVPKNFQGDIKITSSNDDIMFSGVILNNIEASNSNGEIRLNNTRVKGSADIQTTSAKIYTYSTEFLGSSTIKTSNADISASNTVFDGDAVISTSNGDIDVYDISFKNMDIKTENGDISGQAYGSISDYKISARTKNGSNTLGSSTDGKYELNCTDSNGDISLRFDGDKPEAPSFFYYDDDESVADSEEVVEFYDENGDLVPEEDSVSQDISDDE